MFRDSRDEEEQPKKEKGQHLDAHDYKVREGASISHRICGFNKKFLVLTRPAATACQADRFFRAPGLLSSQTRALDSRNDSQACNLAPTEHVLPATHFVELRMWQTRPTAGSKSAMSATVATERDQSPELWPGLAERPSGACGEIGRHFVGQAVLPCTDQWRLE